MKKSLIALAVLAASGATFAQSSVSITGLVGAAYRSVDYAGTTAKAPTAAQLATQAAAAAAFDAAGGATAANAKTLAAADAAVAAATAAAVNGTTTRGFTLTDVSLTVGVKEDLGGGLKAAASVNLDSIGSTSTSEFAMPLLRRNTTLSLTGGFGQVSFTNARSGNLLTKAFVAPSNLNEGLYDGSGIVARSAVDVLTYAVPVGDFKVAVQWVEAGTNGFNNAPTGVTVLSGTYSKGPLAAGVAYKAFQFSDAAKLATVIARNNRLEAFATYDFGVAKVGFGYDGANAGVASSAVNDAAAMAFGVSVPFGAMTIGANYAKRDANNLSEVAFNYDLSKRTSVNASFGKRSAHADAVTGQSGQQYSLGVYHSF